MLKNNHMVQRGNTTSSCTTLWNTVPQHSIHAAAHW